MPHQLYPKPTARQRIKLALHYLTPQHALTRLAGWIANQQWGAATHFIIKQFARAYQINWQEAAQPNPSDYPTFNQFFTRALKDGARPIVSGDKQIALPADGCVSQSGAIHGNQLLQAKGHRFTLADLLAGDPELAAHFATGTCLPFPPRLPPRAYALRRHLAPNGLCAGGTLFREPLSRPTHPQPIRPQRARNLRV